MFPERYSVIVVGPPEAGVLEFCTYLAAFYLKHGQEVVMVETDASADLVHALITEFGGINSGHRDTAPITMIDCFGEPGQEIDRLRYASPADLPDLLRKIEQAIAELKEPVRVIFDSLSSLYIHNAADDVTAFLENLIAISTERGSLTATLHGNMHPTDQVVALTSQCDGLMEMMVDEHGDRYIRIKRMKALAIKPNWVPFEPGVSDRISGASLLWKR
jgi:KaiC/GvpD/RAD55 family RecA-like ATPase